MTEPQTITAQHVRSLLDSPSAGATLGLLAGEVQVVDADGGSDALEVVSRAALVERLGTDPSDDAIAQEAAALTAAVQHIGG